MTCATRLGLTLLLLGTGCTTTPGGADTDADTGAPTGHVLAAGECRDHPDCGDTGESCFTEDDPWCGTCEDPEITCTTADDCADGEVCEPELLQCPCTAADTSWTCVPRCTADSCAAGERCDEDSGLCALVHCSEGGGCSEPFHSCVAEAAGTGCVRDACTVDTDCGEGWCVRGACFPEPGFCSTGPE